METTYMYDWEKNGSKKEQFTEYREVIEQLRTWINERTEAVDKAVSDQIQEVSSKLYDLLDCRGIVRFDYIYDTQN